MATMHSLFFGLLSIAVLVLGGAGDCTVTRTSADKQQMARAPLIDQQESAVGRGIAEAGLLGAAGNISTSSKEAVRTSIVQIAKGEIGVREATRNNDGKRVEEYLAYTGLGTGHAWCAAFVSWCYGQAGLAVPRNAWSPALFPVARRYTGQQITQGQVQPADLFAIYNQRLGRIDHVGIVREINTRWVLTVEGNVDNRVLSKRRPLSTIYAFSNWLEGKEER